MILFIEVDELGRLSLDALSSSMLLDIHHLRNHLMVAHILQGVLGLGLSHEEIHPCTDAHLTAVITDVHVCLHLIYTIETAMQHAK